MRRMMLHLLYLSKVIAFAGLIFRRERQEAKDAKKKSNEWA